MQSQLDKEKILRKVRALIAKGMDEATTEEEANSFLAKAQELIEKHNLESNELDITQEEIATAFFDSYIDFKLSAGVNPFINREWLSDVLNIIAKANLCKIILYRNRKIHNNESVYYDKLQVIGREDKVLLVMELFEFYWKKLLKLCKEAYKLSKYRQTHVGGLKLKVLTDYKWVDPDVFSRSYLKGAADGLREMYKLKKIENYNKNPEYGLIVTNHEKAINVWIEEHVGKLSSRSSIRKRQIDANAYNQGKEDVKSKTRKRLRS